MTADATPTAKDRPLIVYIEDDPNCAEVVQEALRENYEVLCAVDGTRGLDLIRARMPALVLVDLHLPTLTGFQVIEHLRKKAETAGLPLVAISARVMHRERNRALRLGCKGFVAKPFRLETLREAVASALQRAE